MLKGFKVGDTIVVSEDPAGKVIVDNNPPEYIPDGYKAEAEWTETRSEIVRSWTVVPIEGTAQDAALRLTQLQALSLPDDALYEFRALAPEWIVGETYYGPGDPEIQQSRVKFQGRLFKCLTGHVSQADWTPTAAPSLWAEILPGQEGNEPEEGYGEWVQPGADNGYALGDRVMHNGKIWESTFDGSNVWEPGAQGTEALWKDVTDEVSSDDQGGVEE